MPLNVNGLLLAESKRSLFRVALSIDDKPADLLDPAWWVHVASRMRIDDRIEVMGYNREWFAEVTVLEVGKVGGAKVAFIIEPVLLRNSAAMAELPEHVITWAGPAEQWRVVKRKDKTVVKDRFETQEAAQAWIDAYQAEQKAAA